MILVLFVRGNSVGAVPAGESAELGEPLHGVDTAHTANGSEAALVLGSEQMFHSVEDLAHEIL